MYVQNPNIVIENNNNLENEFWQNVLSESALAAVEYIFFCRIFWTITLD